MIVVVVDNDVDELLVVRFLPFVVEPSFSLYVQLNANIEVHKRCNSYIQYGG